MNYTYKQIWLINLPIMVSLLMEQLINLTDSIFLGHVSQIDLGASALAAMYYTAIYMLGFGFSLGAQVVIARRNGEGRHKDVGKVFFQGLFFLSAFAVVVFILFKLFSPALLRMVISSGNVYQATMQYIEWRIIVTCSPFLYWQSVLFSLGLPKPRFLLPTRWLWWYATLYSIIC